VAKQTASVDPAEVTGNPALAEDTKSAKVTARVASHDDDTDTSTVEVTGLHDKALRFETPGKPGEEYLAELVANVSSRWQRDEDRQELIDLHG
jgi:hypothetical protein